MVPDSSPDVISGLPEDVLTNILARLSVRDAVTTSILSRKWRYKWVTIPHLIFTDECLPPPPTSPCHKFVNFVNQVLLLHKGPIQKFMISNPQLQTCSDIDRWILYLSWNEIEVFELKISKSERYQVPSCLFSCQKLSHLKLVYSIIKPPATFNGLTSLTSLELRKVTFANAAFNRFICSCPRLERLTLVDFDGPTHLQLHIPNLKYLKISGKFIDICLENTSLLVFATFQLLSSVKDAEQPEQGKTCNLIKVLGSSPSIEKLVIHAWFLQFLAIGDVPGMLPSICDNLRSISFPLNFEDMSEILVATCLFKSSPNLEELKIMAWYDRESAIDSVVNLRKAQDQLDFPFNQLRAVNMDNLMGVGFELELIKFILANSPILETVKIKPRSNGDDQVLTMLKELLQFSRVSPQAKIVYMDAGVS